MTIRIAARTGSLGRLLLVHGVSLPVLAMGLVPPAIAQSATQPPAEASPEKVEEIVVTGSNIRGASDSGALAVSILDAEALQAFAATSTGELFENIAQAGAAEINPASDGPNAARGDVATVNLRGLGTGNTLVLLNGRRIAAHAVNEDIGATPRQVTNVNAFPSTGIDRVEILRDGASALYGTDATAGVVNTILDARFDRLRITTRHDILTQTNHRSFSVDAGYGFRLNEGRTRVLVSGTYFTRNGLFSSELGPQFNSVDKRAFLGDNPFATETTAFRNTSTSSPFGQFQAGRINADGVFVGQRARVGNVNITNTTGVFSIRPCGTGTTAQLIFTIEGCIGSGPGNLPVGLRYDFNANQPNNALNQGVLIKVDDQLAKGRQLISRADRINAYALAEHDFGNGVEAFAEALYYNALTNSNRATQPLDSGLAFLIIPKQNYWNPLGPVGSPNRIPGLRLTDVPAEGLDILLQNWRPTELGARFIRVRTETYRLMAGLRGRIGGWEWEGAVANSGNSTRDTENNRFSKTLLLAELLKTTPDAINPFGGPNANTQEQLDRARISTTNRGTTTLTTADFRISNSDAIPGWAAPVGMAFGVEWRNDFYKEDRDPRLDGTIIFDDSNVSGISDVVGVSPTRDSQARRNVFSAFGEALIPLHRGEGTWINDLTLQLALRGEYFDDLKGGTVKPKVALSWFPVRWFNLRATYAGGFRAPNLVQLNRGDVSRLNLGIEDFWRAPVTGDPGSTGAAYVATVRQSNPDLKNENTKTYVLGATMDLGRALQSSTVRQLTFSFDYWRFEQRGIIGVTGNQEALALDFLQRKNGSFNPNVVRAPVTPEDEALFAAWNAANPADQRAPAGQVLFVTDPFINLDRQIADGFDFGMATRIDTAGAGSFRLNLEVTYLMTLDVVRNEQLAALAQDPNFEDEFATLAVNRIELNGNPRWRLSGTLQWRLNDVTLGGSVRYVSGYDDTAAGIVRDGRTLFWRVKDNWRVNMFSEYRFRLPSRRDMRFRVGVNNVFDQPPPLTDSSLGYDPAYHQLKGREVFMQLRGNF